LLLLLLLPHQPTAAAAAAAVPPAHQGSTEGSAPQMTENCLKLHQTLLLLLPLLGEVA
jgi:hypothetical protein